MMKLHKKRFEDEQSKTEQVIFQPDEAKLEAALLSEQEGAKDSLVAEVNSFENSDIDDSADGYVYAQDGNSDPYLSPQPVSSTAALAPRYPLKARLLIGIAVAIFMVNSIAVVWLLTHRSANTTIVQMGGSSDAKDSTDATQTLAIDTKTKSVGVGAVKPQGLQVSSNLGSNKRGDANVRLGLLNGSPQVIFENKAGVQWQLGMNGDTLQYGKVGDQLLDLGIAVPQASTVVGIDAKSSLTLQASTMETPNNLAIDNSTLFIDAVSHRVAIGSKNAQGYKLHVTGTVRVTNTLVVDDQLTVNNGSVAKPGYSFQGATSSGLFAANGGVGITVGGVEVLRAQSGMVIVASLETDGYVRAGRGADNPSWQVKRITGTFSSSDVDIAHGLSNSNRILLVDAWYLDSGGNARSVLEYYNNTNIHLTNGTPGKPYRITIMYAADGVGW